MKSLKLFLLLLGITCFTDYHLHAQNIGSKATFHGKMNMKRIPTNVGKYYIILQECDTSKAPKINTSQFIFEHATMGKIKDARMVYEMKNDTVQFITIYFDNEREREQAIKQAQKQFGPAAFSQNNMLNMYHWTKSPHGIPISVSLAYTEHEPTSEMLIKTVEMN
jgi:hypothetical protein